MRALTDSWGRNWTLDAPVPNGGTGRIALHGPYPDWIYNVDYDHNGRLTSITHSGAGEFFDYNTAGFIDKVTDANNHYAAFTTDGRGNVLSQQTCRAAGACDTSYTSYYLNKAEENRALAEYHRNLANNLRSSAR